MGVRYLRPGWLGRGRAGGSASDAELKERKWDCRVGGRGDGRHAEHSGHGRAYSGEEQLASGKGHPCPFGQGDNTCAAPRVACNPKIKPPPKNTPPWGREVKAGFVL